MKHRFVLPTTALLWIFLCCRHFVYAGNIDPDNDRYAYGENVGWVNFEPNKGPGATVNDNKLTGFVWTENAGWVNLDLNDEDPNTGIKNDGTGLLSGLAWGENIGWIDFNPKIVGDSNHYGVIIDHQGNFAGWAWGENVGWIHLRSASPVGYKVRTDWITTCRVDFDDLDRFSDMWPQVGSGLKADFDNNNRVDFADFCYLAQQWLELCPAGWPLKE